MNQKHQDVLPNTPIRKTGRAKRCWAKDCSESPRPNRPPSPIEADEPILGSMKTANVGAEGDYKQRQGLRVHELDREALELLAVQSDGGRYLELDDVDKLVELIPSRTTHLILDGQPIPLWDNGWILAVLVLLLGTEWAIRRRARLL